MSHSVRQTIRKGGVLLAALLAGLVIMGGVFVTEAAPNQQINYQGKLTDTTGVAVENDSYNLRFFLYDTVGAATTSAIWTEEWLVSASNGVPVQNGLFSVMLGSTTALSSVDFNQTLYLGVEIGSTTTVPTWDGEMSPRKRLGTVPSAFEAEQLSGLGTSSFLRSDQADTLEATSASTLLTLIQNGAGAILSAINSSAETVFSVFDSGIVTVGTSTDANIATSTGLAVYNKDVEILIGAPNYLGQFIDVAALDAPQYVEIVDNFAYIVDNITDDLVIVDVSDDVNPTQVGTWNPDDVTVMDYPRGIEVVGNYAYVVGYVSDNLAIIDISNPASPTTTANWRPGIGTLEQPRDVTVAGDYAYITGEGSDNFVIVDISDPTNPRLIGEYTSVIGPHSVAVQGSYAYVTDGTDDSLVVVDISDPTNPIGVGEYDPGTSILDAPQRLVVSGSQVYVVDFNLSSLVLIDVSDPTNPTLSGVYDPSTTIINGPVSIDVAGDYAFIGSFSTSLLTIIDVSSSTNPVLVESVDVSADTTVIRDVKVRGNRLYLIGQSSENLAIYDLPGLITPTAEIGNLLANDIESDYLRVSQALTTDGSLNVGTNALIGGALTITGTASSSLQGANTNPALTITSGYVGIGTSTPYADLSVNGDIAITGRLYDGTASSGGSGSLLRSTGTSVAWTATSSLGLGGTGGLFTDGGNITYLTSLTDVLSIGTTTDIATSTGLAVYNRDIEILAGSPVGVGSIDDLDAGGPYELAGAVYLAVKDNYVFVTADSDDGVQILDISDPANPVGVGSISDGANGADTLNGVRGIAISGNYAYVAAGADNGVQVLDISDPSNPVGVASITDGNKGADTLAIASDVKVSGSYLFVSSQSDSGVQVIDISDPTNPVGVGSITDSAGSPELAGARGISVVGNYAYVASIFDDGVQILDISDPTNPVGVGSIADGLNGADTLNGALDIVTNGKYAYVVARDDNGVQILDISDPTNPVGVGSITDGNNGADILGTAWGADLAGNYLYVVSSGENGVQIIDISSSTNPVGVGSITDGSNGADELNGANDIVISGNYAYVASFGDNGVQVLDLGGLITPTAEIGNLLANDIQSDYVRVTQALVSDGSLNVGTNAMIGGTLTVVGNASSSNQGNPGVPALAVTSGSVAIGTTTDIATSTGLAVYNKDIEIITGTGTPFTKVGSVDDGGTPRWVEVVGNYAYVADSTTGQGLEIIDISDPTNPIEIGGYPDGSGNTYAVAVRGNHAFIGDASTGLEILDISNPTDVVRTGTFDPSNNVQKFDVVGKYAYVPNSSDGLYIVDISDPTNPVEVGNFDNGAYNNEVKVVGNYAYNIEYSDGFAILDVSDPTNPFEVSSLDIFGVGRALGMDVRGNYVYIASDSVFDLAIVDVSDPANPVRVGSLPNTYDFDSVIVAGNYAFIADGSDGIKVVDVSSSTNPVIVGSYSDGTGNVEHLTIAGNYLYAADSADGLEIYDLGGLITPTAEIGNLLANDIESDYVRVSQNLTTDGGLNAGTNAMIGGSLTITGTASSSLQGTNTNPALTITSGYVGIGTSTPYADLSVDGDLALTGGIYDSLASLGTNREVFSSTGSATDWQDDASLGMAFSLFTDGGDITYLSSLTDVLAIGTSTDIATSTGLAVYNRDIEILLGDPVKIGQFDNGGVAREVDVVGNYAYLAAGLGGIEIIDISDPTNPTQLGSFETGGVEADIKVSGNYAFVAADDSGLEIIDISDPTNPTSVSTYRDSPGTAWGVDVVGNYAYVADRLDGLEIIDISDPANPREVGSVDDGIGNPYDVTVVGNYAYVADEGGGLGIFDISDPTNPIEVAELDDGGSAYGVAISGNYAYVADNTDGLEIIDISDPTNPVEVGQFDDGGQAWDVVVVGRYAFVGDQDDGLEVIDISSSTNPVEVGQFDDGGSARGIKVVGNYVYLADDTDGLEIFDLGGLITPTAEIGNLLANNIQTDYLRVSQALTTDGSLNVGTNAMIGGTLTVVGNASSSLLGDAAPDVPALAVTSGAVAIGTTTDIATSTGLAVYNKDVEILLGELVKVGQFHDGGNAWSVVIRDNYAYVADNTDGFEIIDISDPTNPTQVGQYDDGGAAYDVVVAGNYAYVADNTDGLEIVDISDPTNPVEIGGADVGVGRAQGIFISGDYVYMADREDGLEIFDVSDPTNPVFMGSHSDGGDIADDVRVVGNYAYLADANTGLEIIDISDPTNPFEVGQNNGIYPHGVYVDGNFAYVAQEGTLRIVDISDPTNPTTESSIALGGAAIDLVVLNNYAYVAGWTDGIDVVDISSSTNPVVVASYDDGGNAEGVAVSGNYLYVADSGDGLEIFDLGGLITPTAEIGNLLANEIESDYVRVTQNLTTDGGLNVGGNAMIGGALTITGTASSSLQGTNTNPALTITSGYVGIGTSTPYTDLAIDGDLAITGGIYDSTNSLGTSDQFLRSTGSGVEWVNAASLGLSTALFTDGGDITYLNSLTDVLAIGTTTDIATSTGFAVYNRDVEILAGVPVFMGSTTVTTNAQDAVIDGDYLYAAINGGNGNQLTIYDISDPENPTEVSSPTPSSNTAWVSIAKQGNYVYGGNQVGDVYVFDVANPSDPREISRLQGSSTKDPYELIVDGRYLYSVINGSTVKIINISDPTNLQVISELDLGNARRGALQGNFLYITDQDDSGDNLYVVDVSDPTNPLVVNTISDGEDRDAIAVSGSRMYVSTEAVPAVLEVYDISDPNTLTLLGTTSINATGQEIVPVGKYLYVGNGSSTADNLQIYDVSSSTNPVEVASLRVAPEEATDLDAIVVQGGYLYAVDNTLEVYKLPSLITPTAEIGNLLANDIESDYVRVTQALVSDGSLNVGTNAMIGGTLTVVGNASSSLLGDAAPDVPALAVTSGAVAIGTTANIATSTGLAVYNKDIEILAGDPVKVGGVDTASTSYRVTVNGNFAYIVSEANTGDEFEIFDISDPTNPTKVGGADAADVVYGVTISGNYAFLVSASVGDDLEIFDISNPTNPTKVGGLEASTAYSVVVKGTYAYITMNGDSGSGAVDELEIIDISDPANPTKVGGADTTHVARDVRVVGNYAYVVSYGDFGAGATDEFEIFDISDVTNPIKIGGTDGAGIPIRVEVAGNYAYVVSQSTGDDLEIFDLSDPTTPVKVGGVDVASTVYDISLAGNYAYLVSTDNELEVFDISSSTNPVQVGSASTADIPYGMTISGNRAYVVSAVAGDDLEIFDLPGLITPTAEIGNLLANDIESDFLRVSQSLTTDGSLNVGTNAMIGGSLTITGTASSSLQGANANPALTILSGTVGIGTTSTSSALNIDGDLALTGGIYDTNATRGTNQQVLQSTGSAVDWIDFDSLGLPAPLFADIGDITYLSSLTDVLAIGTSTGDIATSTGLAVYNRDIEILPGTPVFAASTSMAGDIEDFVIADDVVYVANRGAGNHLQIIDISDPNDPIILSSFSSSDARAWSAIEKYGNYIIGGNSQTRLFVVDVTDPTNPVEVHDFRVPNTSASSDATRLMVRGNYLYVTSEAATQELHIIDVSDPTNFKLLDQVGASNPADFDIEGNFMFVADRDTATDDIRVYDISDPTNLQSVSSVDYRSWRSIDVVDSKMYLGSNDQANIGELAIYDTSDPSSLTFVASTTINGPGWVVKVVGDYAFVGNGSTTAENVQIFDVSSSTNMFEVGSFTAISETGDNARHLAVSGNYLYVGAGSNFEVYDLGGLITPTAEIGNLLANDIETDYLRVTQSLVSDGSLNVATDAMIGGTLTVVGNSSSSLQGNPGVPSLAVTSGNMVIGSIPTTTDIATSTGLAVYNKDIEIFAGNPVKVGDVALSDAAFGMTVSGDYAYVASDENAGHEFEVFNISDASNPTKVGGANAVIDINTIQVSGNYAYVGSDFSGWGFRVFDISDPTTPVQVGGAATGGDVWRFALAGNYAYVASLSDADDLEIFDISNPTNPLKVGGIDIGSYNAWDVSVVGNYAYLATASSTEELQVFDISDPTSPTKVGGVTANDIVYSITVHGNYAYLGSNVNADDLEIFDISDPTNPTKVGGVDAGGAVWSVNLVGNYAYLSGPTGSEEIKVFDVSSSTNPVKVGGADAAQTVYSVALAGNYLYAVGGVVDTNGDLEIYDLGGLITPTAEIGNLLANDIETDFMRVSQNLSSGGSLNVGTNALIGGSLSITGTASSSLQGTNTNPALTILSGRMGIGTTSPYADLAIDGDMALSGGLYDTNASLGTAGQILQSTGSGVEWVSTSTLNIVASGALFTDGGDITYLTDSDDVLSIGTTTNIATSTGLAVYNRDIEILPGDPVKVGGVGAASQAYNVTVVGDYAYVVTVSTGDDLEIFDISDPTNPTKVGGADAADSARDVSVVGNYAYVVSGTSGDELEVFDVSDPSNPYKVGGVEAASTALGIAIAGNYAYVVTTSTGDDLEIFDISDPTNPTKVGGAEAATSAYDVTVAGNYAYVVSNSTGDDLEIFDISDPTNPTKVGGAAAADGSNGLAVSGTYAYVVSNSTGDDLEIFDISDPTNPTKVGGAEAADDANGVTVSGNYAYVVSGTIGSGDLEIFNVSSSTNPVKVGSVAAAAEAYSVTVSGNYAYVVSGLTGDDLEIFDLGGLITPTAEIGNLVSNDIETNFLRVTQSLISDSLNVNTNGMIGGALTITGTASSTLIDSNGRTALRITSGFIEIGTTTATSGIQIGYGAICVDNDGECSATTTGRISSVSSYQGNSDLAENYFSAESLETGTIVELDSGLSVQTASPTSTNTILGVVSTKPGLLLGFDDTPTRDGEAQYPIALKGRVPVKVSTENGAINPGDHLMLSSISGTAMKAKGTGEVIGIALEAFTPTTTTYYSDTFINQYLDNLSATDDKDAIEAELKATPVQSATLTESNDSVLHGASPEEEREVQTGQIIMFVDLSYRYVDERTNLALTTLMGTTSEEHQGSNKDETLFDRLVTLGKSFVDGVLSVTGLKVERAAFAQELCIENTCLDKERLQVLIEQLDNGTTMTVIDGGGDGQDNIAVDVSGPTPVVSSSTSTTGETSSTTTNTAENGDNSATSSPQMGDNGGTAPVHSAPLTAPDGAAVDGAGSTTEAGESVAPEETTESAENTEVDPQPDQSSNDEAGENDNVETSNDSETTTEEVAPQAPEAPASGNSEQSAPAPESGSESEVVVEDEVDSVEEEVVEPVEEGVINEET